MRDVRCRESLETIRAALVGNYQPEHIFALSQALLLYDAYQERIADCDRQLERALQLLNADKAMPETPLTKPRTKTKQVNAPKFDVRAMLYQLTGIVRAGQHAVAAAHPCIACDRALHSGADRKGDPGSLDVGHDDDLPHHGGQAADESDGQLLGRKVGDILQV